MTDTVNLYLLEGPMHGKVLKIERRDPNVWRLPKPENADRMYGPEVLHYKLVATFEDGSELAVFDAREQVTKKELTWLQDQVARVE